MYYPYLRARQFELIALRELVTEDALQNRVVPILEPVKRTFNNFDLAFRVFAESNQKAFIIINPDVGEMKHSLGHETVAEYVQDKAKVSDIYRPAFHYSDKP